MQRLQREFTAKLGIMMDLQTRRVGNSDMMLCGILNVY